MDTKLGALYYPDQDQMGNKIPFDSLYIPAIYNEIWNEGLYVEVLNQQKDMTILDIGANIGVTVQHFLPYAKKIYAVEPSPEHFAALKMNKEYNHWDNVELFQAAIANTDGEMKLAQNSYNRTMNSLMVGTKDANGNYKVSGTEYTLKTAGAYYEPLPVKTIAFDTFFKENNIDRVDFCKFDVEGAEDLILRSEGFKKVSDKIKCMIVEFHYPNWQELVKYMIELGYQAKRYESTAIVVCFTR